MKKGKTVYVVMVNDSVDSVWTDETKATKRANKLHDPDAEKYFNSMFAHVHTLSLNEEGTW